MVGTRALAISLLAVVTLTLGGCKSEPQVGYQEAYEQKMYAQALEKASMIATDERADDRQKAALVAGMSAQQLGQTAEAKKWLKPLMMCPDKSIAARAKASLGLIAKNEGRNAEAATLLSNSAEQLDGNDAAQAQINAGDAYRKMGLESKARESYANAKTEADDPAIRATADEKGRPVNYFVQCGAYSTRQAADRQVKAIRSQVTKAGQPAPTVLQMAPNGTPLFVVQVGPYTDKQAAMVAKAKMGMQTAAVTARQ